MKVTQNQLAFVVCILLIVGGSLSIFLTMGRGGFYARPSSVSPSVQIRDTSDSRQLTQQACVSYGGTWNACGSACRGKESDVCIELCIEQCVCTNTDQCPDTFVCSDVIDGQGICK